MQPKKPRSFQSRVSEKSRKKPLKTLPILTKTAKNRDFFFNLFLSKTYFVKSGFFFVLHSVHQDASFELSKTAFWRIFRFFFYHKWGPFWFRGVKINLSWFIVFLQSKLTMFCDQGVKNYTKAASGTKKSQNCIFVCIYWTF